MAANRAQLTLRLQPLLATQHAPRLALARTSRRHASSSIVRQSDYKFDDRKAPPPLSSRRSSLSSSSPSSSPSSPAIDKTFVRGDDTKARTVFIRPKDGNHLVSVVHTLSLLAQLASKFGPIQSFHFPREPSSQRLLGYGSVTFLDRESLRKALANDGIHTVVLPPVLPSRAPRTYLSDEEHERIVGTAPLISCDAPSKHGSASQTHHSSRSLQNPSALRPGWTDIAPLVNMEAALSPRYYVDESRATAETPEDAVIAHDASFYLSTSSVSVEIKMEHRITALASRPGARADRRSEELRRNVRAALHQFGGFNDTFKNTFKRSEHEAEGGFGEGHFDLEGLNDHRHGRTRNSGSAASGHSHAGSRSGPAWNRRPDSRMQRGGHETRSLSTSATAFNSEMFKAKRKAEWQRNRHSNFIDQLYLRVTGGKGGDGCVSFHREKYVQFGPPSGGNGGSGGSIYIRAVEGPTTLARISRRFRGADGPHGQGSFLHGKKVEDKVVEVPVGTVVTATRRLRIPEEVEAETYYQDLLRRAAKAKWDPTGLVAKEDIVLAAEHEERSRLARLQPPVEADQQAVSQTEVSELDSTEDGAASGAEKANEAEEEIDGEDLLDPEDARQLQLLRDRVWRHYPRAEETYYRRNEFRAAEMRLAIDRRRRRRYQAQAQAALAAAAHTVASSSIAADQSSAASVTPYEDEEPLEQPWRIDLDEPTPADSPGILLAAGGRGGLGNPTFLSSANRSPKFATKGEWGEALEVMLELKRPSDIGLVGLPNAGKSTILRSISASKAQVGHWRFTTLSPNLGVVRLGQDGSVMGVDDSEVQEGYGHDRDGSATDADMPSDAEEFRLVLSDIPGLIDGAADNRGLGHTFLRHIERCSILAYVLDLTEPEPWKDLGVLHNELASYRSDLPAKARLVIINKADQFTTPDEIEAAKTKIDRIRRQVNEIWEDQQALRTGEVNQGAERAPMKVLTLSAKKKQGTQGLAKTLVELLREARSEAQQDVESAE
ncbi:GTPase [Moesziomyces antarcticus]|uniref:Related to MTG2 - Mitochondrial GTP binding protein n=2 Tax=Pseudozyma antarctica TaxID=84753 RepID=A0A5C3FVW7_PSEA2|nr:GTPase [Moesziomyces antarcticus]GAK66244.1 GTPase [Moesziomyces antarcticus]SPO48563.1 related to MTG2 - Mitochondrial GTP binding protein [Moesziomyces antarcticus]